MSKYQVCTRCIMDITDIEITFDEDGICNHCRNFENNIKKNWFPNEEGRKKLESIVNRIKLDGRGKKYDCIMGLSGGVDSSFLAYKMREYGLRILAVHVDAGWNSEIAVENIKKICEKLNIDLYTIVVDWEEMRDLQVAFMQSNVANQDTPQDHAFFAGLYNYAIKEDIKYVLSGSNYATEGILPTSWGYSAMDLRQIESIHSQFGKRPLKTFPKVSFFKYYFYYPYMKKIKVVRPLNYMPYNKNEAIAVLEQKLDWCYYGGKHYESKFTRFFQAYYLPTKFGYDKRTAHLSSLIVSGQMTRDEALKEMEKELYDQEEIKKDKLFVLEKLELTEEEFEKILKMPNKTYSDYDSNYKLRRMCARIKKMFS